MQTDPRYYEEGAQNTDSPNTIKATRSLPQQDAGWTRKVSRVKYKNKCPTQNSNKQWEQQQTKFPQSTEPFSNSQILYW